MPYGQAVINSAFDYVRAQLEELVAAFGLEEEGEAILAIYHAIFRRSLAFSLGRRPAVSSRLNEDGTPIQFATSVGIQPASLRFVGDPGPLNAEGLLRMHAARSVMEEVVGIIGAEEELGSLDRLLAELTPQDDPALRDDPAGAFWIGAAFASGASPRLRIYVNSAWGGALKRWERIRRFVAHFDRSVAWEEVETRLPPSLTPLGMALTLTPRGKIRGTIYFRAFGLRLEEYVVLAQRSASTDNAEAIRGFGTALLGDESVYPAPSAVFSFGFGPEPGLTAELEFCAHCLFTDDAVARQQLKRLFSISHLDAGPYMILDRVLSPVDPRKGSPRVHSFIGVDVKYVGPVYTIYMKPDLSAFR